MQRRASHSSVIPRVKLFVHGRKDSCAESTRFFFVRDKIENFVADYNSTPCGVVVVVVAAVAAVAVPPILGANEKWDNFLTL